MGQISDQADEVYRDFVIDGVPASGPNDPEKPDIRSLFSTVDTAVAASQAGITTVATIADRDTFYADPANQTKLVYVNNNNGVSGDPANGVYEYVGGAARIAQGFYLAVAAGMQTLVSAARSHTLADDTLKRVKITSGGTFTGGAGDTTGAFKIKLPTGIDARNMVLSISIMDNYGEINLKISGVNNVNEWDYAKAVVWGDHQFQPQPNVRLGKDANGDYCVWIGDTNVNFWAYPQVWINWVNFGGGPITETWMGDWAISLVTAFDTVTAGPIVPKAPVTNEFYAIDNSNKLSMAIGVAAKGGTDASNYNQCIGYYSGNVLTTGLHNTFIGFQVGAVATTAEGNTGSGLQSLSRLTTGSFNTAYGIHAMLSAIDAIGNVCIGGGAMEYMTSGQANVALGMYAGRDNQGDGNVFIGNHAGPFGSSDSNKLYIANNENEELIGGDFSRRTAHANGTFTAEQFVLKELNTAPASATATGTAGEVRVTADYIYVCTAANTWVRAPLATW